MDGSPGWLHCQSTGDPFDVLHAVIAPDADDPAFFRMEQDHKVTCWKLRLLPVNGVGGRGLELVDLYITPGLTGDLTGLETQEDHGTAIHKLRRVHDIYDARGHIDTEFLVVDLPPLNQLRPADGPARRIPVVLARRPCDSEAYLWAFFRPLELESVFALPLKLHFADGGNIGFLTHMVAHLEPADGISSHGKERDDDRRYKQGAPQLAVSAEWRRRFFHIPEKSLRLFYVFQTDTLHGIQQQFLVQHKPSSCSLSRSFFRRRNRVVFTLLWVQPLFLAISATVARNQ